MGSLKCEVGLTMEMKYMPPTHHKTGFNCPYCHAFSEQTWFDLASGNKEASLLGRGSFKFLEGLEISTCRQCGLIAIWIEEKMIWPAASSVPMPSENMPEDVKADYSEARSIINNSPRSACALLRLAIQKLMLALDEKGKDLNDDIKDLVKKGLPTKIQKALDSVRVIGNEAIHPGTLDLKDDVSTASAIFELVNMIVEVMITQPKEVDDIYSKLPESKKVEIARRDSK